MPKTSAQAFSPPRSTVNSDYVFTAISAWLIPGAGHWLLGYRVRGAVLLVSILGLFWVGQALAVPADGPWKPIAVSHKLSPVFFGCQVGNGFFSLLSDSLWGKPGKDTTETLDRALPSHFNLGILFTSVSGLLNFLLVLHILDPRTWAQAVLDRVGAAAGPEAAGENSGKGPREGAP